ncbi:MAG: transcriptional regulator [Thermoleophilia bacterium]|nr:transcriptional regulator [Thermoleophilia bacterium]
MQHDRYAEEARQRWGATDQWADSTARAASWSEDNWHEIREEADLITSRFEELHAAGIDPTSALSLSAAEDWRAHLTRWYYDATPAMLRGLGDLYVSDPRFTAFYDGADGERAGLAEWVRDALTAYADDRGE